MTMMQRCTPQELPTRLAAWTQHVKLRSWIEEHVRLFAPESVHFCDGSVSTTFQFPPTQIQIFNFPLSILICPS
jgi:GTP-dependent phosphoenolpyruvate carboxykinase